MKLCEAQAPVPAAAPARARRTSTGARPRHHSQKQRDETGSRRAPAPAQSAPPPCLRLHHQPWRRKRSTPARRGWGTWPFAAAQLELRTAGATGCVWRQPPARGAPQLALQRRARRAADASAQPRQPAPMEASFPRLTLRLALHRLGRWRRLVAVQGACPPLQRGRRATRQAQSPALAAAAARRSGAACPPRCPRQKRLLQAAARRPGTESQAL